MDRMNDWLTNLKGVGVAGLTLIGMLIGAMGWQLVTPNHRMALVAQQVVDHAAATAMIDAAQNRKLEALDSITAVITQRLDILVDLACVNLTADQRVLAQRRFRCLK